MASKLEDVWAIDIADLVCAAQTKFGSKEIRTWEQRLLSVLQFDINVSSNFEYLLLNQVPTVLDFLVRFFNDSKWRSNHDANCDGRCNNCGICGTRITWETHEIVSIKLQNLRRDQWKPLFTEGRGRSAVEACSIYVAEVFLAHPESLSYTYDMLAGVVLLFVITVLAPRGISPLKLMVNLTIPYHLMITTAPQCN